MVRLWLNYLCARYCGSEAAVLMSTGVAEKTTPGQAEELELVLLIE